jgi:PilZ domain
MSFDGSTRSSDSAIKPEPGLHNGTRQFEMSRLTQPLAIASERRGTRRFKVDAPITLKISGREVPAYTRDLSNRGAYFYLALSHSALIDLDIEFVVELPPEITLSTCCRIQCRARLLRKEKTSRRLVGIAVEILNYSIPGQVTSTA